MVTERGKSTSLSPRLPTVSAANVLQYENTATMLQHVAVRNPYK